MGAGRWSKWSNGADECHAIEFGFKYRFDIRGGPKSDGIKPDFWWASSRDGSLGEFPTFEAAAQACEDEAKRVIPGELKSGAAGMDASVITEQWQRYLSMPHRLKSRKTRTRYK